MRITHLALGGCLRSHPVRYGITADTGGHIAYVVDAAAAQAALVDVAHVSIATRLFENARLGVIHANRHEYVGPKLSIDRIPIADRRYVEKEELAALLPALSAAFCRDIARSAARPDVIHAHFADAAAIAIEVRRRFGIPFVYTPHALGLDKQRRRSPGDALDARIAAEREVIALADAIIVSTRDEGERQIGGYAVDGAQARVRVIPPGVPRAALGSAGGARDIDPSARPILLAIARPVRKKNLIGLARAYAACPALIALADLVILAGDHDGLLSDEETSVLAELKDLATLPALAGHVRLPPRHSASDVKALYAQAARGGVFVNPALHEPFGLTLIEAAAAGVPVVATLNGGAAEIVAEIGHGLLVDPHDEGAIAAACLALLTDSRRHAQAASAGRANVRRFDWNRYAEESIAVYRSLRRLPLHHKDRRPDIAIDAEVEPA